VTAAALIAILGYGTAEEVGAAIAAMGPDQAAQIRDEIRHEQCSPEGLCGTPAPPTYTSPRLRELVGHGLPQARLDESAARRRALARATPALHALAIQAGVVEPVSGWSGEAAVIVAAVAARR
jgi:hypothetical protein